MANEKTIALTRQTFVSNIMSLLFNMLSRLVTTCLPRSKRLLISWLQSSSAVILEPPKIKSVTISIVSPSICDELMGPDAVILVFWLLSFKPTFSLSSRGFLVLLCFRDQIANIRWIVEKARELQKSIYFCFIDCQSLWLCGSQQTVENSERDGNTRSPNLPLEKSVCISGSNS